MIVQPTIWVVGSLNADLVQTVERIPEPGETLSGGDLQTYPGGKGANQAFAASRLGGQVKMIGNVGHDQLGALLLESLESADVDVSLVKRIDTPTGAASIFVMHNGENAIVISSGANGQLSPSAVRERLSGIKEGDYLLCQLESPIDTVMEALCIATAAGATTILDPSPATHFDSGLFAHVNILTPNETEACSLLGEAQYGIVDSCSYEKVTTTLRDQGCASVLLKLGESGCYFNDGEQTETIAAHRVNVVDTTGAGDTFNGALAVSLAEGRSISEALAFANAAAGLAVTKPGAQTSIPSREEVESLMTQALHST